MTMKARLTRYITKTSSTTLFAITSLIVVLIAAALHQAGSSIMGLTEFSNFVDRSRAPLLPLRLLIYAIAVRYWWSTCRLSIARSPSPQLERRARNRITVAGVLFLAAVELSNWGLDLA